MKYAIVIYEREQDFAQRTDPKQSEAYWGAWMAYAKAMTDAGVMVPGGAALQPGSTGTTVRLTGGQRRVQDGPFAAAKEQLGGFMLIDVPTIEAALEWAARSPAASYCGVEVRPVLDMKR